MKNTLDIDETLLDAVIRGVRSGFQMSGIEARAVGASRLASNTRPYSVIVGLVGRASGTVTLQMGKEALLQLAGGMIGEPQSDCNDDVFDAIMEIGNMTAGGIKDALQNSEHQIAQISLPSIVLGANYNMYYARGIHTVSVQFEVDTVPANQLEDRFVTCSIALLRGTGRRSA